MGKCRMAKGLKDPCRHVAGVGGQYKMYNSLIFINFISRSKRWNQKSKSCIKRLFTVNELLRLWYFVSVLNLKFLYQLERRHCKDTPYFRRFYIGAPKGPFLWGLNDDFEMGCDFPLCWPMTMHENCLLVGWACAKIGCSLAEHGRKLVLFNTKRHVIYMSLPLHRWVSPSVNESPPL